MNEPKIIAVHNNKGGVGKTTNVIFTAQILAHFNSRVLVIDCDPQANTTSNFQAENKTEKTISDVLLNEANINEVIKTFSAGNVSIDYIPSNAYLFKVPNTLLMQSMMSNTTTRLKKAIESLEKDYDFILLDSSPYKDTLTTNVLTAANEVIIPIRPDNYSISGIDILFETIDEIKMEFNPDLKIGGIYLNAVKQNTKTGKEIIEYFNNIGDLFLKSYISDSVRSSDNTFVDHLYIHEKYNYKIVNEHINLLKELKFLDEGAMLLKSDMKETKWVLEQN